MATSMLSAGAVPHGFAALADALVPAAQGRLVAAGGVMDCPAERWLGSLRLSSLPTVRHRQPDRRQGERRRRDHIEPEAYDPTTGLLNRNYVERLLSQRRRTFDRRGCTCVAMISVGHRARPSPPCDRGGDDPVAAAAAVVRQALRAQDLACVWSGGVFLVLRPDTSLAESVAWAEQLREELSCPRVVGGDAQPTPASIGLYCCRSDGFTFDAVARAGEAKRRAERLGPGRVCPWELVAFDAAVCRHDPGRRRTPEERAARIISHCRPMLGSVQYEHLTTHARQVTEMALRIGRALELSVAELSRLRTAGVLHDLGKFAVPETVLGKLAPLTVQERALVARHADDGAEMSSALGADVQTAEAIRRHHARFDGTDGGPGGEQIPLAARILNVADAMVTMLSHRPYQTARSLTAVIQELRRETGGQFDPGVVRVVPGVLLEEETVPAVQAAGLALR